MKHYVETRTIKHDGSEVIERHRVATLHAASSIAWNTAEAMFGREVPLCADMVFPNAPWFINDFGERVNIRAVSFGDMAQIEEGRFRFLDFGKENLS